VAVAFGRPFTKNWWIPMVTPFGVDFGIFLFEDVLQAYKKMIEQNEGKESP